MTAGELLSAALNALARADAEELARLTEVAGEATLPVAAEEWRVALIRREALARLLQMTRRNLWLLRGEYREPCGYGAPRD